MFAICVFVLTSITDKTCSWDCKCNFMTSSYKFSCRINAQVVNKAFNVTVVNQALPSLHDGTLEITFIVPIM